MNNSLDTKDTVANRHRAALYGTSDLAQLRAMVAGKSKTDVSEFPELGAVVYCDPAQTCAMGFSGKKSKPDFHYTFRTPERCATYIREWLAGIERANEYRAKRRAVKDSLKGLENPYKVGDVFHYSWGWEQTNCEFWQVVEVKGSSIVLREIAQTVVPGSETCSMADRRLPVVGKFLESTSVHCKNGETSLTKRVQWYAGNDGAGVPYISMKYGSFHLWDGRSKYCSWYG